MMVERPSLAALVGSTGACPTGLFPYKVKDLVCSLNMGFFGRGAPLA
jgi:hypothetical protein